MDTKTEFQQLTETWYTTIGGDHHKDRDCHFRVYVLQEEFSYGNPPESKNCWMFEHNGYIIGDVIESFVTEQEMYEWACEWLQEHIQHQINCDNTNDEVW